MIDAIARGFLGHYGSLILDWYTANSLWVNSLFILYAVLVVFARRNFHRVLSALVQWFLTEKGEWMTKKTPGELQIVIKKTKFPWEQFLTIYHFPLITGASSILVRVKSVQTLQAIFTPEMLAKRISKAKPK